MFESLVWHALRHFDPARPVFVEAESRRIGALRVPEVLLECMRNAACIRIETTMAERVRFLIEEYRHFLAEPAWLKTQLLRLTALHSGKAVGRWLAQIDAGDWQSWSGTCSHLTTIRPTRDRWRRVTRASRMRCRCELSRLEHDEIDAGAGELLLR